MKIPAVVLFIVCVLSCNNEVEVNNNKDLEQNMMDLKIYQENLGDEIKSKDLENASWLLEGMDSILLILNKKFQEHRKLSDPFSYFYRKRLQSPIKGIRNAIKKNDTAKAMENYRLLVKRCNDCHADNDIDKVLKF